MKQITTEKDYENALAQIEELMDTPEDRRDNAKMERLAALVMTYEELHYAIEPPPVAAALQFRMEQERLNQSDICRITGISKSRISEIISGKREPTKDHILAFHYKLGIPLHHLLDVDNHSPDIVMDYETETGYPDLSTKKEINWNSGFPWDPQNGAEAGEQFIDNALALAA